MPIPSGVASTHTLTDIANAIRFQNGENRRYQPGEMADAIEALDGTGDKYGMQYLYSEPHYGRMSMLPYTAIANAIRGQNGETCDYKPSEMADAIRELEWKKPKAYALLTFPESGTNAQKLLFVKTLTEPQPMSMYNGMPIQEVYTDFEDAIYTSNSQVPWYSKHDNITSVEFVDPIKPKSCAYWFYMFRYCTSFDVAKLDTSEVTSLAFMFYYCSSVASLDLSTFVTSNVTSLNYTFYFCTKLETLTMGNWDMTNLQVFAQAFRNLTSILELDLSGWTMPEWTSTMQYTFYNCSKLTTIYAPPGCDLTDTAVNSNCFSSCTKLVGGNGTAYNSGKVTAAMARIDGLGGQQGYFSVK